jgi:hypothetical protein
LAALLLYGSLASYQLGLPGLHYDEAAEAGVNAMQLLTGAPVTAFRGATLSLFGWHLPLMVQDYIGALNVYLALPVLALTGIGVPNLRFVAIATGMLALLLIERTVSEWQALLDTYKQQHTPHSTWGTPYSVAALLALTLLAASPSFVFWSRQGIFVTNLTQPLCFCALWQGLRWLRTGRARCLLSSAFAGGLAIYAKLLAIWVIGPFVLLAGSWWLWLRLRRPRAAPPLPWRLALALIAACGLALLPLLLFNWQTGGTWDTVVAHLGQGYYGADNRALLHNALVRGGQVLQSLRGDQFWYLGAIYSNPLAPWLAGLALGLGLICHWRLLLAPLILLGLTFLCSLFTVSDLFVTHYALLHPLLAVVIGLGLASWIQQREQAVHSARRWRVLRQALVPTLLILWLLADLNATVRYHRALGRSGGVADHSDVSYHLAYYLRFHGLGAPIVLDWGLAAPVRYLSAGTVTPIEIFGYTQLAQPDAEFSQRLQLFFGQSTERLFTSHSGSHNLCWAERSTATSSAGAWLAPA